MQVVTLSAEYHTRGHVSDRLFAEFNPDSRHNKVTTVAWGRYYLHVLYCINNT